MPGDKAVTGRTLLTSEDTGGSLVEAIVAEKGSTSITVTFSGEN